MDKIRPGPRQSITIFDAMILVAGSAGWFALLSALSNRWHWSLSIYGITSFGTIPFASFLAVASFSLIIIRLRPPRPRRRALWRQPGFTACFAACLGVTLGAIEYLLYDHASGSSSPGLIGRIWWSSQRLAGASVLGAWLMLGLTKRWRAERGWIDLSGRVVGVAWLLVFILMDWEFGRWSWLLINPLLEAMK